MGPKPIVEVGAADTDGGPCDLAEGSLDVRIPFADFARLDFTGGLVVARGKSGPGNEPLPIEEVIVWGSADFGKNGVRRHCRCLEWNQAAPTGLDRYLPMNDAIRSYLLDLKSKQTEQAHELGEYYTDSGYVCRMDDGRPLKLKYVDDNFAKILIKNDLPKIHLHELRHTVATVLLDRGFVPRIISQMLGHADDRITNRYLHPSVDSGIPMAQTLGTAFVVPSA